MRYLLFVLLLSFNAYAVDDVSQTRSHVSSFLNDIVKDLKNQFKPIDESLKDNVESTKQLEEDVKILVENSDEDENNPTILKHGKQKVKTNCNYDSENLNWTGSEWRCLPANVLSDCIAASDEYKISKTDGSYVCQRNSSTSGGKLNSYWKFTGHSVQCSSTTGQFSNIYGCFYKNKLKQEVQLANSECSGKSKPTAPTKTCTSSWTVSAWGTCSKSCGTGTQSRTVTCPAGKVCLSTKPVTVQNCNTHVCTTSWRTSSWSACNKSCGGGSQTRSVTCPSGYVCNGAKPATSQSCNTQSCTASWKAGSWSVCSKTCGGGSQTRTVYCPTGFACPGAKPTTSQSCNTHVCPSYIWMQGHWGSCSKTCGGGTQTRTVRCVEISNPSRPTVSDRICLTKLGTKPALSQSCNTQSCAKGCSKYSKSATYCSKNHGTVTSSRSSYTSGQSELVGVVSRIDRKYEVEYRITCDNGVWKESGSKVPFNYQTGEKYKCGGPSIIRYTCAPYGSGWTLSGNKCNKTTTKCKYDSRNKVSYYKYGSYNCLGPSHDRKYTFTYNGRAINSKPTSSTSYGGYSRGAYVHSHTCGGGSSGPSGKLTYYKICAKETETKPAVAK